MVRGGSFLAREGYNSCLAGQVKFCGELLYALCEVNFLLFLILFALFLLLLLLLLPGIKSSTALFGSITLPLIEASMGPPIS